MKIETLTYVIKDPMGLHARPAGLMVKSVSKLPCRVTIQYKDKQADGKRLFSVMGLGVKINDTITIICEGEKEKEAIELIKGIFESENL